MEERESQGIEVIFERENVGGNEETGNPFTQILIQTEFKTAIMKLPMCMFHSSDFENRKRTL